ncbi:MAG: diacylglycerol kinase family protein [Bacteroidota bacterium]
MEQPVYIIVNPYCHQGNGWKRWLSVKADVLKQLPGAKEIVTESENDLAAQLKTLLQTNEEACIICAGGDGTIHYVVNTILKNGSAGKSKIAIGAIGLGSSNDFLKPYQSFIKKIPVSINITKPALWHDAGKAVFIDENNRQVEKYFIVNASFGATAQGNWNFNNPGRLLKWLKQQNTSLAITYTAITTILSYKNNDCVIRFNGEEKQALISNINLLKTPYVSGTLHYKQDILPDDGRLGLNICINMNNRQLLQTLFHLEKGRFTENENKISTFTDNFYLESMTPVVFECDGETEKANRIQVTVIREAIRVLSS